MTTLTIQRLSDGQFKDYCSLVHAECGIHLTNEKRELLNARISKRLRKLGVQPDTYLKIIRDDSEELSRFVDAVSTNHTFFFRESRSFSYIGAGTREIWCAAASSGEEPYSLAAYCHSLGIPADIWATDISDTCLHKGRKGIYPIQGCRHIPQKILKACFQKGCRQWEGYFRVRTEVKQMVHFGRFNLLKDETPNRLFDIIFCRNVMIYFDNPTKEHVVRKLVQSLKPGGFFIIGGAESLNGLKHALKYIEPSIYQRG